MLSTITRRVKPGTGSSSVGSNYFNPHKTRPAQKTRTDTCCIAPIIIGNSTQDMVRERPESGGSATIIGDAVGGRVVWFSIRVKNRMPVKRVVPRPTEFESESDSMDQEGDVRSVESALHVNAYLSMKDSRYLSVTNPDD